MIIGRVIVSSALSGAKTGAISINPVVGTIVGAAVGAAVGATIKSVIDEKGYNERLSKYEEAFEKQNDLLGEIGDFITAL